ncbi:hypothetical protein M422DRAFT_257851 [Sphaerobolus stellatus SS14]|uniref:Uncharacterized protein n=1 Tax=Sphaerobolus stellatus (strain SS14) TaxID=990650 RepID=A0A0C9UWL0_SPHS4|nr:hypothetical protein M422DRAFT_257851 [Sphaerobolus stellatus SS14]
MRFSTLYALAATIISFGITAVQASPLPARDVSLPRAIEGGSSNIVVVHREDNGEDNNQSEKNTNGCGNKGGVSCN